MDLQPTNTSVEMDCAIGAHMTRGGGCINGSDRSDKRETRDICKIDVKCNIAS